MTDSQFPEYQHCTLCPRNCGVNRYETTGYCHSTANLKMNVAQLHFGEEPPISGTKGSGTIFLSNCNLQCVFCQNYQISDFGQGKEISLETLVQMMLDLQNKGAHNINFVTPTHFTPHLRQAIIEARKAGLHIPIVWNSNAYEKVETLKTLEGLVDIYLPDLKYAAGILSYKYSAAKDYPAMARSAIQEMHRQAGNLVYTNGIASRGLIIRLLVLPNHLAGIRESLYWIHENLGPDTYISLMGQYYPTHKALEFKEINRSITPDEYNEIAELVSDLGFVNGFIQDIGSTSDWTPKFIES
jgi:putative pyruvate formate lyase activating enzyme